MHIGCIHKISQKIQTPIGTYEEKVNQQNLK